MRCEVLGGAVKPHTVPEQWTGSVRKREIASPRARPKHELLSHPSPKPKHCVRSRGLCPESVCPSVGLLATARRNRPHSRRASETPVIALSREHRESESARCLDLCPRGGVWVLSRCEITHYESGASCVAERDESFRVCLCQRERVCLLGVST